MKPAWESSADRISDLPADVINSILVFLPIKDAAKTSVLARKWRYHWRSIPELVLDGGFAKLRSRSESEARSKLIIQDIYRSLLVHEGPIPKFELSIPWLDFCDEIDHIFRYLSTKGVQDLTILRNSFGPEVGVGDYQIHSSLFSALNLKSLILYGSVFTPPTWFVGFSKLTSLVLGNVLLPCDFFKGFLPKCPMLEYLKVVECIGLARKLEVVAPFLKSFTFVGYFLDISFKCAPLLSCVNLGLLDCVLPDMPSLFASLPALQKFHVNPGILKIHPSSDGNVPTRLPTPLYGLKVLHMDCVIFDSSEMERVFVFLIKNAPNLRRLTVQLESVELYDRPANHEVTNSIKRLVEAEDCQDCLQHLREFRIEDSRGTQVELGFIRFVLAIAPLLRLVHITPCGYLGDCYKLVMKLMKEMMRYKRVSKEAEIIYDWNDKEA